jgi:hypothetical protein
VLLHEHSMKAEELRCVLLYACTTCLDPQQPALHACQRDWHETCQHGQAAAHLSALNSCRRNVAGSAETSYGAVSSSSPEQRQ